MLPISVNEVDFFIIKLVKSLNNEFEKNNQQFLFTQLVIFLIKYFALLLYRDKPVTCFVNDV